MKTFYYYGLNHSHFWASKVTGKFASRTTCEHLSAKWWGWSNFGTLPPCYCQSLGQSLALFGRSDHL